MRKRGAHHSRVAVKPLGIKSTKYEMDARAALVALKADCANEQHLVDLYVLADMCEALNDGESHIKTHCESIKRLCNGIYDSGYHAGGLATTSMTASVDLLLRWFHLQSNAKILRVATRKVEEVCRA